MREDGSDGRLDEDLHFAWSYAVDAAPTGDEAAGGPASERFRTYARFVLDEFRADPERISAIAAAARARLAEREAGGGNTRGWLETARLAEMALEMLRQAGDDVTAGPGEPCPRRAEAENARKPTAYRHIAAYRRRLRRLTPRYWLRRRWARRKVRFVHRPPATDQPCDVQRIDILLGEREIGRVTYQVCDSCELGYIARISLDPKLRGRGIGARALDLTRRRSPGFRWCASGRHDTDRTFWHRVSRRTGGAHTRASADPVPCEHMRGDRNRRV
ncbi:hypothetical protein [Streptosporangium carneum]|uniref:Uncharacterized protein n=1 Tax=Streptosporangium carneum TaxID=47481 RepID=A0A9W6MDV2_9ACTN|nr:hypothetical protein [Streptosporangium carneum]GLK10541.1 hypothetical protein GCM10017600_39470 [Streptosporangium carneum]